MKLLILSLIQTLIRFNLFILIHIHSLFFISKNYKSSHPYSHPPAHSLSFDPNQLPPLQFKPSPSNLNYKSLLRHYKSTHNKELLPIKRRKPSTSPPPSLSCPFCNAPSAFIYLNNGGKGQFKCKICHNTFCSPSNKSLSFRCPHCFSTLSVYKIRTNFIVLKCKNKNCKFYLKNLSNLSPFQKSLYLDKPFKFKLHYIYRIPNFNIRSLKLSHPKPNHLIDLSKIRFSQYILGLALTFSINLALSTRETAYALYSIFDVKISHQTIHNWLISAAFYLSHLTSNSFVHISNSTVADETYIRIAGNWGYTIFAYDYKNHKIASVLTSHKRDSKAAATILMDTLSKIPSHLLHNITLVSDKNPIYSLALSFINLAFPDKFNINHFTVKGIKNQDEISTLYRPVKQIIERLNRTYKRHYRVTTGFANLSFADAFNILFMVFFNYLRPHSALNNNTPCLLYTSPSPRDLSTSRMPSSA